MVISHNMNSLNIQRHIKFNSRSKGNSVEKLTSGYKINGASDDAAGLTISEKMRWQIRGLLRGNQNCEEAVSLCQVAEGAMSEVHDMLQRMNELSIQAANDTNTDMDREAIDQEVQEIKKEIDRIGNETLFNEIKVLQGQKAINYVQEELVTVTYTEKDWVEVEVEKITDMSLVDYENVGEGIPEGLIRLNRRDITSGVRNGAMLSTSQTDDEKKLSLYYAAFNLDVSQIKSNDDWGKLNGYGFTVNCSFTQCTGKTTFVFDNSQTGITHMTPDVDVRSKTEENVFVVGTKDYDTGKSFVDDFTSFVNGLGRGGYFSDDDLLRGTLTGNELIITISNNRSSTEHGYMIVGEPKFNYTTEIVKEMQYIDVERTREEMQLVSKVRYEPVDLNIQYGACSGEALLLQLPHIDCDALDLSELCVLSRERAVNSINMISNAISMVSDERSRLGAYTNRLNHLIANQNNVVENTQAAESRIRDADMAEEMLKISINRILEKTGYSLMTQANQNNATVIELLSI